MHVVGFIIRMYHDAQSPECLITIDLGKNGSNDSVDVTLSWMYSELLCRLFISNLYLSILVITSSDS